MAELKKNCQRCESSEEAKEYDPRTPGHPHKRIYLCKECGDADPKAVPIDNVVPTIDPAVPSEDSEFETQTKDEVFATEEHGPATPEPISIPTPKDAPPEEPQGENTNPRPVDKPVSTEPIERQIIRDKLAKQEGDFSKLIESRQAIVAKLTQVNSLIEIKKGAIAALRDALGNEG